MEEERRVKKSSVSSVEEAGEFLETRKRLGVKPGLGRMYALLKQMNNPHRHLKAIHIAGTNGKGSTVSFLKSVLMEAGYQVGTFTSPHKRVFSDMIEINDQHISDKDLLKYINQLLPVIEKLDQQDNSPSEFEILTAIALAYLHEKAEISIIETGMGGLEDTTNVIQPLVSVITTIGLDHLSFLGDTYEEVAYHKAGIIKEGVPVVIGKVPEKTKSVFEEKATLCKTTINWLEEQVELLDHFTDNRNENVKICVKNRSYHFRLKMLGKHQIDNTGVALLAIEQLQKKKITIHTPHIIEGMNKASLPGRFEIISTSPTIILDSAHNRESIAAFISTAERFFTVQKKQLLFAAFRDKPLKEMILLLDDAFNQVTLTSFHHKRAAETSLLFQLSNNKHKVTENWKQVIHSLTADETLFITGSADFIMRVRDFITDHMLK